MELANTSEKEENTRANGERKVSEHFDFQNLRLMVEGFPVCYEMQKLTSQGIQIEYQNQQRIVLNSKKSFQFDRQYVLMKYCRDISSAIDRVTNTSSLTNSRKKSNLKYDFEQCIRLLKKIPKSLDCIENVLLCIPFIKIKIIFEHDETYFHLLKIIHQLVYKQSMSSSLEEDMLQLISSHPASYQRVMIMINHIPAELKILNSFYEISKQLVEKQLSNYFSQKLEELSETHHKILFIIKSIKSIYQFCFQTSSAVQLIKQNILTHKTLDFVRNMVTKIASLPLMEIFIFFSLLSLIGQVSRELLIILYKGNEQRFQLIFLRYMSSTFTDSEKQKLLDRSQLYSFVRRLSHFPQFCPLVCKFVLYTLELSPYLREQELDLLSAIMHSNITARIAYFEEIMTSLMITIKILKNNLNHWQCKNYRILILQSIKLASFCLQLNYQLSTQFLNNLQQLSKRAGRATRECWNWLNKVMKSDYLLKTMSFNEF